MVPEAFADRAYAPDGRLVPRRYPGAVLHDVDTIVHRCLRLATEHKVDSIDGAVVTVPARSICVHGDTPQAVTIARRVRQGLLAAGVRVTSFTGRDT